MNPPLSFSPSKDVFLYTDITDPLAQPLFEDLGYEYTQRYGEGHSLEPESAEMQRYPPILFRPPLGGFVLLLRDGVAISGGAFMPIDNRTAELKRIWTRSDFRRQGHSSRVLAEIEAEIARRGYTRIFLTTGTRQPEARNLYLKAGYTPLFDVAAPAESLELWPFEKIVVPVKTYGPSKSGVRERITEWQQQRAVRRAWTLRRPILRRLDDLVA